MTPTEGTDAAIETVDTTVVDGLATASAETPETADIPTETTESIEQTGAQQNAPYRAVSEDGKRLDAKAHATIEQIKATDPQLASALRKALFEADGFRRALPGGLKEVNELRQTIDTLGGPEGIQGIQAEVKGWNDFDQQYMAGDPKALEFMLSTPESQQAFMKLAPMAFSKFEELNPDGYASYICQRIVGDAVANRIPVSTELVQHYLAAGDTQKAAEEFAKINNWLQALDATAKKPVAPPKPPEVDNAKLKELETQNHGLVRDQWRQETAKEQNTIYSSELNRLLGGRKVTDAQREDILFRVQTKLGMRIKEHEKTLDRYFAVKDKDGFLKFANSFSKKHIPELLREAVDRYVPSKPGPKSQPSPVNGAPPVRPPMNGKSPDGFQYVQQMPKSSEVDWGSPFTNIRQGRAATVDGKKVTWRKTQ